MRDYRDITSFEIELNPYEGFIIEGYLIKYLGDGRLNVTKSKSDPVKLDTNQLSFDLEQK